jgi:hypothetical protein
MSAVLLAVFDNHEAAEGVRTDLVRDGFPTDRVELTAGCEPGRAALEPASSPHGRFLQYFRALLCEEHEAQYVVQLTECIERGAATITVHPRGPVETARVAEIFKHAHPTQVVQHDLHNQSFEHAAARQARPWVHAFWLEPVHDVHCIYCRMFEHSPSEHSSG